MNAVVKKIGGVFVAEIPAEIVDRFGLAEGDEIEFRQLHRPSEDERAVLVAGALDRHAGALSKLAQSERMDRVTAIMDRYDEALAELAK